MREQIAHRTEAIQAMRVAPWGDNEPTESVSGLWQAGIKRKETLVCMPKVNP